MYYRSGSAGAATAYQTGYTKRAVVYGAVAVGMIYFYSRGAAREKCLEGSFAYGRTCRACSDWECPVGQFRTTCTPHSDSYCKRCSNAPMDANTYAYTTPGNNNDCQYAVVKTSSDAEIFDEGCMEGKCVYDPQEEASLLVFLEVPVDAASFQAMGAEFRQAVAVTAGFESRDTVTVTEITEYTMSSVNDLRRRKTLIGIVPFMAPHDDGAIKGGRRLMAVGNTTVPNTACNETANTTNQSNQTGCAEAGANTSAPENPTSTPSPQAPAGNPDPGECTPMPQPAADKDEKFVVVATEISTTVGKVRHGD